MTFHRFSLRMCHPVLMNQWANLLSTFLWTTIRITIWLIRFAAFFTFNMSVSMVLGYNYLCKGCCILNLSRLPLCVLIFCTVVNRQCHIIDILNLFLRWLLFSFLFFPLDFCKNDSWRTIFKQSNSGFFKASPSQLVLVECGGWQAHIMVCEVCNVLMWQKLPTVFLS